MTVQHQSTTAFNVFDRSTVRRRRVRAAPGLDAYDFLLRAVADNLAERLTDVRRRFATVLDIGRRGLEPVLASHPGIVSVVIADLGMVAFQPGQRSFTSPSVVADEEHLPFADRCFDLVISLLGLHSVNDLPGALVQIRRILRPDGLFLGALFGGETLCELRMALAAAESAEEGGVSPRVAPFVDVRDAGALLQRAGFALPVADSDTLTVKYDDAFALMRDLRGMGESNSLSERRRTLSRRATLFNAAADYQKQFADREGRVPATFQILTMTAWAPHDSQPRPLARGGANAKLGDAL